VCKKKGKQGKKAVGEGFLKNCKNNIRQKSKGIKELIPPEISVAKGEKSYLLLKMR